MPPSHPRGRVHECTSAGCEAEGSARSPGAHVEAGDGWARSREPSCGLLGTRCGVLLGRARSQDMGAGRGARRTADRGSGARAELARGAVAHGLPPACHRPEWLEPPEAVKPKKPPESGDSVTHPSGCAYFPSTKAEFPFPGIPGTPAWCSGFIRFGARVSALERQIWEFASAGPRVARSKRRLSGGAASRSLLPPRTPR